MIRRPSRNEKPKGLFHPVAFEFAVECGDADAQQTGGFGLVAPGVVQHPENVAAFEVFERQRIGRTADDRRVKLGGEAVEREAVAVGHDHAALHDVAQFADVARPRMAFEGRDVAVVDRVDAFAHFGGELRREEADVFGNVAPTFCQRRQLDAENRQPEKEVPAETACGDLPFEVAVRGGDQTHIDPRGARFSDLDELPAFEHPQQFGLQFGRHLPDLIEEQRAFVGLFEESFLVFGGSRKTACTVAEQLAFEQLLRKGRTVDRDKSLPGPRTGVMNGLGEDLLAGSRFAREQHRGVRGGDLAGWTMLFSNMESLLNIKRIIPIEITAAGMDAETVIPTLSPKYALAPPNNIANKAPIIIDVTVNSGITLSAGI